MKPETAARLTPSQRHVVEALENGHTTHKAIAKHCGISWRTVQSHLLNAFNRLGVNSKTELLMFIAKGDL